MTVSRKGHGLAGAMTGDESAAIEREAIQEMDVVVFVDSVVAAR